MTDWLTNYKAFKATAGAICSTDLPTEITELQAEKQTLPRLQWAAGNHAALAEQIYQQAREDKKPLALALWAREDSANALDAIKSRAISVGQALSFQNKAY